MTGTPEARAAYLTAMGDQILAAAHDHDSPRLETLVGELFDHDPEAAVAFTEHLTVLGLQHLTGLFEDPGPEPEP